MLIWKFQGVNGGEKLLKGGSWECLGFLNLIALHELINLLKIL